MADPAQALEAALAATAEALEAGDPEGAAQASSRAAEACAALDAAGARLGRDALTRLAALQARCDAAAGGVVARLGAELDTTARATRAAAAYRR